MTTEISPVKETVNILIVEDSPTQAEQLKYLLEEHSFNVTIAANGTEALECVETNPPTLVITDIIMPGMNGYELCRKIKSDEGIRDIPVILLTSLVSSEDVLEGLACGADIFISKPYSEEYLISNIANILVNMKLRKTERVRVGVEIRIGGKNRFITADQQQMLGMLMSTYEAAVIRNTELIQAQEELTALNDRLEEMVEERTAELKIEIAERKLATDRVTLARDILYQLNIVNAETDFIHELLQMIKKYSSIEAVGLRIQEGDDYPYYETNGFPGDFVNAERYLCEHDADGNICRDSDGNPVLECMCGNVIRGRIDTDKPFFTTSGSFWSNCTSDLLATTTESDRQSRTRNRCNGEGYESVALIPLRSGSEIIGLLQLNDHRPNCFTLDMIHFYEGLGASIGIAITRSKAEKVLQEKLKELQRWYDAMLNREDRVMELKKEVNDLLKETGKPPRYAGEPEG